MKNSNQSNFDHFFQSSNFRCMDCIQIFLRVKNDEDLKEILLVSAPYSRNGQNGGQDILWESRGEYYLEAFQCGSNPNICSIEKDQRILNEKEEIAFMILEEFKRLRTPELG